MNTSLKMIENSMSPVLNESDRVYFKKMLYSDLKVGDIIVYNDKTKPVVHRIVYSATNLKSHKFITKGDCNQFPDKPITPYQILGKVYQIKRGHQIIKLNDIYSLQASFYIREIEHLDSYLVSLGIPYVYLKGVIYSLYFGKIAPQRITHDCDILINPKDLERIRQVFSVLGYQEMLTDTKNIHSFPEIEYTKKVQGFNITFDVHLDAFFLMFNPYKSSVFDYSLLAKFSQKLITNRRLISIDQLRLPILPLNYLVVYLALDIFHHNFKGYHKFNFLHQIVKNKKINFIAVLNITKYYQFENFIYPVISVIINHYESPIPSNFLNNLKPSRVCYFFTKWFISLPFILISDSKTREAASRFLLVMLLSPQSVITKLLSVFTRNTLQTIYLHTNEMFTLFFKKIQLQLKSLVYF